PQPPRPEARACSGTTRRSGLAEILFDPGPLALLGDVLQILGKVFRRGRLLDRGVQPPFRRRRNRLPGSAQPCRLVRERGLDLGDALVAPERTAHLLEEPPKTERLFVVRVERGEEVGGGARCSVRSVLLRTKILLVRGECFE